MFPSQSAKHKIANYHYLLNVYELYVVQYRVVKFGIDCSVFYIEFKIEDIFSVSVS